MSFIKLLKNKGLKIKEYDEIKPSRNLPEREETIGITWHHSGVRDRSIISHHNYHVKPKSQGGKGWIMVGYHVHIRPDGLIEIGRPIWSRGAHAGNEANNTTIGAALSGNMNDESPTDKQYNSAILFQKACNEYYEKELKTYGHKDWSATPCPGDNMDLVIIEDGTKKDKDPELSMKINNRGVNFDLKIENGRTFVKLDNKWIQVRQFIDMIPKASINWDGNTRTVLIDIPE